jgi:hypothetical protein
MLKQTADCAVGCLIYSESRIYTEFQARAVYFVQSLKVFRGLCRQLGASLVAITQQHERTSSSQDTQLIEHWGHSSSPCRKERKVKARLACFLKAREGASRGPGPL